MKSVLVIIATLISMQAFAKETIFDTTGAVTILPTVASAVSSMTSTSHMDCGRDYCGDKLIIAAKDDAANFVASEGKKRGVHLNTALEFIRNQQPALQASDIELAQAIVAF
jgi:uncharacterized protein (TIGR02448 family)